MNWPLFFSIYSVIFLAELPDKTAFATLLMAAKGAPRAVFLGVAVAFLVQCAVAVGFGFLLGLFPERWVHVGAGLVFLGFAAHTWFSQDRQDANDEKSEPAFSSGKFWPMAWRSFVVVFLAEWGDLTQLATASFAARYNQDHFTVFCASLSALWSVTAIAVVVGHRLRAAISPRVLAGVGTAVFAAAGIYFLSAVF